MDIKVCTIPCVSLLQITQNQTITPLGYLIVRFSYGNIYLLKELALRIHTTISETVRGCSFIGVEREKVTSLVISSSLHRPTLILSYSSHTLVLSS